jgi:hypothetical protein
VIEVVIEVVLTVAAVAMTVARMVTRQAHPIPLVEEEGETVVGMLIVVAETSSSKEHPRITIVVAVVAAAVQKRLENGIRRKQKRETDCGGRAGTEEVNPGILKERAEVDPGIMIRKKLGLELNPGIL